jgi:hypothetical protein
MPLGFLANGILGSRMERLSRYKISRSFVLFVSDEAKKEVLYLVRLRQL